MKLKCIIVDDEPRAIEILERYISRLSFLELIKTLRDSGEVLNFISSHSVDLVFLDINMPELSGIQLAKLIDKKAEIVFVTAYSEYALEGFDLEVGDYLLKPVSFERFVKAAERVKHKLAVKANLNDEEWIVLKSGSHLYRVRADDILFLEKESNYLTVHTNKKKILIRMNMNEAFDVFPQKKFVQVHKSFIVALNAIDYISSDIIHIQSNEIPISRTFRDELMSRFYGSLPDK